MQKQIGVTIHFNDGTSMVVGFPEQVENRYAREIMQDEIVKRRMIAVEADGAMVFIPFENIKYISAYPAPEELPRWVVRGASLTG
jgi:hypothetical protein